MSGHGSCIARLLNLVETLAAEGHQLRAENQRLREEVSRLKGQPGKPNIPPNRPAKTGSQHSSEQERREPKPWHKGSKNQQLRLDRQEKLEVDPRLCPQMRSSKKAKHYSPQERQTYLAAMPAGWEGGFGPGIKALAITFAYGCNLAQPKLAEWFGNMECAFRRGRFPICW